MDNNKESYSMLNCLKIVFIMMIVLFHTGGSYNYPSSKYLQNIYDLGGVYGNHFFFMFSGFFICLNYQDKIVNNEISFKQFLYKRIKKVYPIYIAVTAVQIVLWYINDGAVDISLKTLVMNLFLITSGWIEDTYPLVFQAWFLSQLLLCYIIFYAVNHYGKRCKDVLYVLIAAWGYILLINNFQYPFMYRHNGEGFCSFFVGVILCEIHLCYLKSDKLKQLKKVIFAIVVVLIVFACTDLIKFRVDLRFELLFVYYPILFLLFAKTKMDVPLKRIGNALGAMSTYIYLWHCLVSNILNEITHWTNTYTCYIVVLVIFSYVAYKIKILSRVEKIYLMVKSKYLA